MTDALTNTPTMAAESTVPDAVKIYTGNPPQRDYERRTLAEILAWDNRRLEYQHDYIQVLFPLTKPSAHNGRAPFLTVAELMQITSSPDLLDQVRRGMTGSLHRMLRFYGLTLTEGVRGRFNVTDGGRRDQYWWRAGNHNAARITRILQSLRLFGLHEHADAIMRYLMLHHADHSSRRFWGY